MAKLYVLTPNYLLLNPSSYPLFCNFPFHIVLVFTICIQSEKRTIDERLSNHRQSYHKKRNNDAVNDENNVIKSPNGGGGYWLHDERLSTPGDGHVCGGCVVLSGYYVMLCCGCCGVWILCGVVWCCVVVDTVHAITCWPHDYALPVSMKPLLAHWHPPLL